MELHSQFMDPVIDWLMELHNSILQLYNSVELTEHHN